MKAKHEFTADYLIRKASFTGSLDGEVRQADLLIKTARIIGAFDGGLIDSDGLHVRPADLDTAHQLTRACILYYLVLLPRHAQAFLKVLIELFGNPSDFAQVQGVKVGTQFVSIIRVNGYFDTSTGKKLGPTDLNPNDVSGQSPSTPSVREVAA